MLIAEQEARIIKANDDWRTKAEKIYGIKLNPIKVEFGLRGVCGGKAHCSEWKIRYNPILAAQNFDNFLVQTVGHEVAHLVAYFLHGRKAVNHGPYWKQVMVDFGLEPNLYHDYDVTDVKINMKRFVYACPECDRQYRVTKVKHNRFRVGSLKMSCRDCGRENGRLIFDHEIPAKGGGAGMKQADILKAQSLLELL